MKASALPRIVLGIDPGFDRLGYGYITVSDGRALVGRFGCISTSRSLSLGERLSSLACDLDTLLDETRPHAVGIETLYFLNNAKTAMGVSQARGVILLAIHKRGIPVIEYTPLQVKLATTGAGNADKRQVQAMITRLLRLPAMPKPDDAADALAIAYCTGFDLRVTSPQCS